MFGLGQDKDKADCPLWQEPCHQHRCRWFCNVRGKMPQTEEVVDRWDCSLAWFPYLLVENSQRQHQTAADIESLRNVMVDPLARMAKAAERTADTIRMFHSDMVLANEATLSHLGAAQQRLTQQDTTEKNGG